MVDAQRHHPCVAQARKKISRPVAIARERVFNPCLLEQRHDVAIGFGTGRDHQAVADSNAAGTSVRRAQLKARAARFFHRDADKNPGAPRVQAVQEFRAIVARHAAGDSIERLDDGTAHAPQRQQIGGFHAHHAPADDRDCRRGRNLRRIAQHLPRVQDAHCGIEAGNIERARTRSRTRGNHDEVRRERLDGLDGCRGGSTHRNSERLDLFPAIAPDGLDLALIGSGDRQRNLSSDCH